MDRTVGGIPLKILRKEHVSDPLVAGLAVDGGPEQSIVDVVGVGLHGAVGEPGRGDEVSRFHHGLGDVEHGRWVILFLVLGARFGIGLDGGVDEVGLVAPAEPHESICQGFLGGAVEGFDLEDLVADLHGGLSICSLDSKILVSCEQLVGIRVVGEGLLQDLLGESVILKTQIGTGVGRHGAGVGVLLHELLAYVDRIGVPGGLQADLHLHDLYVGVLGIGGLCQLQEVQRFGVHSVAGEDGRLAYQCVRGSGVQFDGTVERFHRGDVVPFLLLDASVGDPVGGVVHVQEDRLAVGLFGRVEVAELLVGQTLGVPNLGIVLHEGGRRGEGGGCFQVFPESELRVSPDAADVLVAAVFVVVVLAELLYFGVLAFGHQGADESHEVLGTDHLGHLVGCRGVGEDALHLEVGEDLRRLGVGRVHFENGTACLDRMV